MKLYRIIFLLFDEKSKRVIDVFSDTMESEGYPMVHEIYEYLRSKHQGYGIAITACTEISS